MTLIISHHQLQQPQNNSASMHCYLNLVLRWVLRWLPSALWWIEERGGEREGPYLSTQDGSLTLAFRPKTSLEIHRWPLLRSLLFLLVSKGKKMCIMIKNHCLY